MEITRKDEGMCQTEHGASVDEASYCHPQEHIYWLTR